jgi:hypothetical protein
MKNLFKCLVIALILAAAPAVMAQPSAGDWEFTLGGGGDSDNDFHRGGFSLIGSAGYFFTPNFEAGLRQSVTYDAHTRDDAWAGSTRAAFDYHFLLGKFVPFVGGNFGLEYNERDSEWAIGPEIGAKYYVYEKTFLFLMGEYRWFFDRLSAIDNNADDGRFLFTVGIGFNVGGGHHR